MRIDWRYFLAEILVLWLPLTITMFICKTLNINWIVSGLFLLVSYFLVVLFNRSNRLFTYLFHVEKQSHNSFFESILFFILTAIGFFITLHLFNDALLGVSCIIFIGVFAGSLVIGPDGKKDSY
ncbi:MAG: hypothetical protein M3005_05540 [Apilactobacillus sp.]|uniref:hypothetical protein n=1 Tax=Apilactobacillus sp. TaxID=2767901 RepID=UPI0025EDD87C|nr:hypothetical protein [Apilactobacillus sp.]MCT6823326.1 hypothetical protein [Apilactobacillus sp.]MCT6858015.1 hypothetical protein [Apilactobacillus sp.]